MKTNKICSILAKDLDYEFIGLAWTCLLVIRVCLLIEIKCYISHIKIVNLIFSLFNILFFTFMALNLCQADSKTPKSNLKNHHSIAVGKSSIIEALDRVYAKLGMPF